MELRIGNYHVKSIRGAFRCSGIPGTGDEGHKFSLWERERGIWRVSYQRGGKQLRKHVPGVDLSEALYNAGQIFHPAPYRWHTISEVFASWKRSLTCSDDTRERDYGKRATQFFEWATREGLVYWSELRLEHIQAYLRSSPTLAAETIRKRLNPIRRAAKWAALNWRGQYHDFTEGVQLDSARSARPSDWWTFERVFRFALWIRYQRHGWNILPGIVLTGFSSIRVQEALRLEWRDYDGDTLRVRGLKTTESDRVLPLPRICKIVLDESPRGGDRILSSHRNIWSYGHAFRRYIDRRDRGYIEAKGLRRTLVTEAMRRGWYGDFLQLYRGHRPSGLSRIDLEHYAVLDEDWLTKQMRSLVTDRIDAATEKLCQVWQGRERGKVVSLR